MAVRIVRLGEARQPDEGLRIGTVRRPPRGVRKADFARRDYYDVWLPELAPSEPLRAWALSKPFTPQRFAEYEKKYRREMSEPAAQRLIALLAALSASTAATKNKFFAVMRKISNLERRFLIVRICNGDRLRRI